MSYIPPNTNGQKISANSSPVVIASDQSTLPVSLATAPTTPVTGTFWQTTQPVSLATLPALAAGSALLGSVGIDQTTPGLTDSVTVKSGTVSVKASITRPSDTAAYTAGDIIGTATGSTAAIQFAAIGAIGKVIRITGSRLEIDVTAIPSGMTSFRLHLYSVTPPSALGDNAAWDLPSGDRSSYLGYVDLGSPVDLGSTLYIQQTGLDYDFSMGSTVNLFGYLVTNGAFTPSASTVKVITIYAMAM
jgi:hypothetical protein